MFYEAFAETSFILNGQLNIAVNELFEVVLNDTSTDSVCCIPLEAENITPDRTKRLSIQFGFSGPELVEETT